MNKQEFLDLIVEYGDAKYKVGIFYGDAECDLVALDKARRIADAILVEITKTIEAE